MTSAAFAWADEVELGRLGVELGGLEVELGGLEVELGRLEAEPVRSGRTLDDTTAP